MIISNARTAEKISIHSLRMEGDFTSETVHDTVNISIHSLRMEGDNIRII